MLQERSARIQLWLWFSAVVYDRVFEKFVVLTGFVPMLKVCNHRCWLLGLGIAVSLCVLKSSPAQEKVGVKKVDFESYHLSLPSRFEAVVIPEGALPDFMKMAPFQASADGEVVEAVSLITNSLPPLVAEGKKDLKAAAINFFHGMMRRQNLQIGKAEELKAFDWNGHHVRKFKFPIRLPSGDESQAILYVFFDGDKFVCFSHLVYAGDADQLCKDTEAAMFAQDTSKKN